MYRADVACRRFWYPLYRCSYSSLTPTVPVRLGTFAPGRTNGDLAPNPTLDCLAQDALAWAPGSCSDQRQAASATNMITMSRSPTWRLAPTLSTS